MLKTGQEKCNSLAFKSKPQSGDFFGIFAKFCALRKKLNITINLAF
jgi:hypothetical protein